MISPTFRSRDWSPRSDCRQHGKFSQYILVLADTPIPGEDLHDSEKLRAFSTARDTWTHRSCRADLRETGPGRLSDSRSSPRPPRRENVKTKAHPRVNKSRETRARWRCISVVFIYYKLFSVHNSCPLSNHFPTRYLISDFININSFYAYYIHHL